MILVIASADSLAVYAVPGADIGVAWGNGTGAPVEYYRPLFRVLNESGISVVAATTKEAGDGRDIVLAGEALEALGCVRIVACGHSQGGGGASRAAAARPDLFDAVCMIMPGGGDVGWLPCFIVSGQNDRLAPPRTIERDFVRWYPGPVVHGERKGIGHLGWSDREVMWRVTLFALDDQRWLDVLHHSGWRIYTADGF